VRASTPLPRPTTGSPPPLGWSGVRRASGGDTGDDPWCGSRSTRPPNWPSRRLGGLNSWHDAATFTLFADTPTFSFGHRYEHAHAVNECVSVDELVDYCAIVALTAMRWCGVAG